MNVLTPVAIWLGSISWVPRFLPQITAFDKFLQRITKGQWSLLRIAGLPSMMLTVLGRRSGIARSTPRSADAQSSGPQVTRSDGYSK